MPGVRSGGEREAAGDQRDRGRSGQAARLIRWNAGIVSKRCVWDGFRKRWFSKTNVLGGATVHPTPPMNCRTSSLVTTPSQAARDFPEL